MLFLDYFDVPVDDFRYWSYSVGQVEPQIQVLEQRGRTLMNKGLRVASGVVALACHEIVFHDQKIMAQGWLPVIAHSMLVEKYGEEEVKTKECSVMESAGKMPGPVNQSSPVLLCAPKNVSLAEGYCHM